MHIEHFARRFTKLCRAGAVGSQRRRDAGGCEPLPGERTASRRSHSPTNRAILHRKSPQEKRTTRRQNRKTICKYYRNFYPWLPQPTRLHRIKAVNGRFGHRSQSSNS